jgi:hypothetical protein
MEVFMQHSSWLLALIVLAYVWHAILELMDRYLEKWEWFSKRPKVQEGVFAVGAMLLLAPASYYGVELYNLLQQTSPTGT